MVIGGAELHVSNPGAGHGFTQHFLAGMGVEYTQIGGKPLLPGAQVNAGISIALSYAESILIHRGNAQQAAVRADMGEPGKLSLGQAAEFPGIAMEIHLHHTASLQIIDNSPFGIQADAGLSQPAVGISVEIDI